MRTTWYFEDQVRRYRPYIGAQMCRAVIASPLQKQVQPDGRMRQWAAVIDPRDQKQRFLRVVTLEDGETIHNAFFDRNFGKGWS